MRLFIKVKTYFLSSSISNLIPLAANAFSNLLLSDKRPITKKNPPAPSPACKQNNKDSISPGSSPSAKAPSINGVNQGSYSLPVSSVIASEPASSEPPNSAVFPKETKGTIAITAQTTNNKIV